MKKLLLLALPICLLTSFVARSEDAVQPEAQTETKAVEVDPKADEFKAILQKAFEASKDQIAIMQKNFDDAFVGSPELVKYVAEKYPEIVATTQEGNKVIAVQCYFGIQVPA